MKKETMLDFALAIAIGIVLATVLFLSI